MPDFYVTFGQRETWEPHPTFPLAHPDGWVRVAGAADRDHAHALAYEAFGQRWSMLRAADELGVRFFPRGELGVLDAYTGELVATEPAVPHG